MPANQYGIDLPGLYRDQNALMAGRQQQQMNSLALQKGQMELDQAPQLNALALQNANLGVQQKKTQIAGEQQAQTFAKHANDVDQTTRALSAVVDPSMPDDQLSVAIPAALAKLKADGVDGIDQLSQEFAAAGNDPVKLRAIGAQQLKMGQTYAAQLTQKNSDRTFKAQQDNTAAVRESTDAYRKATLAQGAERNRQGQERINQTNAPSAPATISDYGDNILDGNASLSNVPAKDRPAVSSYMRTQLNAETPIAAARSTMAASRITAPYTNLSQYKLASDAQPYLQRIDAASKTPGPVADQDMLDSLTKLNTGGNAITDAQVSLITDHKSYADALDVFAKKFKSGGSLSDSMRKQIVDISHAIAANYLKGYQPVYEAATTQLKAAGIKPQFWTIPDLSKFAVAAPDVSESKTIGGVTYHKVDGQWMQ